MCFGSTVAKEHLAQAGPGRPIGAQFLSGPPINSLEFLLMPVGIRRLWLLSMTREAAGYTAATKEMQKVVQKGSTAP